MTTTATRSGLGPPLLGAAAAALALGAAVPVIVDAVDSGPQTVALADWVGDQGQTVQAPDQAEGAVAAPDSALDPEEDQRDASPPPTTGGGVANGADAAPAGAGGNGNGEAEHDDRDRNGSRVGDGTNDHKGSVGDPPTA